MLKSVHNFFFSNLCKSSKKMQEQDRDFNIQLCQSQKKPKLIKWEDGTIFVGQCEGNVMEGTGKLIFPSGDYYEGQFKRNNFHGFGKYTGQNGIYKGEWQYGLKCGFGKQQGRDGSKFTGRYENGLKQGIGLFQWSDGSFYYGMFKDDQMEGPGKMVNVDGSKIQGEWKDNQISGYGRQTDIVGNVFKGYFKNGIKNGNGILIEKQQRIEGFWVNGQPKGVAIIQTNDGIAFCGKYQQQKLVKICDQEYQELRQKFNLQILCNQE